VKKKEIKNHPHMSAPHCGVQWAGAVENPVAKLLIHQFKIFSFREKLETANALIS
jgi:hypothetical protein